MKETAKKTKGHLCRANEVPEGGPVSCIAESLDNQEENHEVAEFFRILGDPTRIRILKCLLISPLRVCDLSGILNMTQSAVSHQLRVLRTAAMVKYRRTGREVVYSLKDNHVEEILNMALHHIRE